MNKKRIVSFILLLIMTFNLTISLVSANEIETTEKTESTEINHLSEKLDIEAGNTATLTIKGTVKADTKLNDKFSSTFNILNPVSSAEEKELKSKETEVVSKIDDLRVTNIVDKTQALVGDNITYSLKLENTSNNDLLGIEIIGTLPNQLDNLIISDNENVITENTTINKLVDIKAGETVTLSIKGTVKANTTLNDKFSSIFKVLNPTFPEEEKEIETEKTEIVSKIDSLQVTGIVDKTQALKGDEITYLLELENISNTKLSGIEVESILPIQLENIKSAVKTEATEPEATIPEPTEETESTETTEPLTEETEPLTEETEPTKATEPINIQADEVDSNLYGVNVDNSIDANSGIQNFLNDSTQIKRIIGADRIGTSVLTSQFTNNTSDKVVLASSKTYADALSASSITFGEYPILLVADNLSSSVINEIVRLQAKEIIILGGTNAINSSVEASAKKISTVEKVTRIAGADRYSTSIAISKRTINTNAVVASGMNYPDALAGTILTKNNADLILSYNTKIHDSVKNYLLDFKGNDVKIVGGNAVINDKTYNNIKSLSKTSSIQRIAGANRYGTSVSVANKIQSNTLIIASGEDFPDALSASTLSQKINAPILLVSKNVIDNSVINYIKNGNFTKAIILGGDGRISNNTANNIQRLMNKQDPIGNYNPINFKNYAVSNGQQKVYATADYNSAVTGTMTNKRIMKILGQTEFWLKVNYDKTTGWIEKSNALAYNVSSYGKVVNNVPYISQLYPVYAPRGCELTSLLMGLKGKGYAQNINLKSFLDNMPRHASNPAKGYVSTPYETKSQYFQTIDPEPLAKYGQKYGNVVNIQNSSIDDIIVELQNGNTVVIYVTLFWKNATFAYKNIEGISTRRINNNHVLLLTGYDPKIAKFYIADPYNHEKAGASRTRSFYYWKDKATVDRLYRADNRKFAVTIR